MTNTDTDTDLVDRIDSLALPFVFGMALGLTIGRFAGTMLGGVVLGLGLFIVFGWVRLRLEALPQ